MNTILNIILALVVFLIHTRAISQTDTILIEDFSSESLGFVSSSYSTTNNYQIINDCSNEPWEIVTSHSEECSSCSGRYAGIYYDGSCTQHNTFVTKEFSPVTTTISISFDYSFNSYTSDYFKVYLYNETDGAKVGSDLLNLTSDDDDAYSSSVVLSSTNTVDDKYTLRFEYYGYDDWGASFDNILITENLSGGNTVSIGNGTSNIRRYPFDGYFDYSHTMFIYTDDELGSAATIEDVQFELGGYSTPYYFNDITIKLAHTSDEQFGTNVKVDLTNLDTSDVTTVLENYSLTISSNGWTTLTFDNTFDYNGTDNLLIIIENRDGSWSSGYGYSENTFDNCSCANDYMSWYKVNDGSYPSGYGTRDQSYRPNVRFLTSATILPIELISFNGEYNPSLKSVNLKWTVASQINNDYFTLEHSIDGFNWTEFDNILGSGTTSNAISYKSTHNNPINGINYYRLTQVDYDGNSESFNVISVNVNSNKNEIIKQVNILGQEIDNSYTGIIISIWDNGEISKSIKTK